MKKHALTWFCTLAIALVASACGEDDPTGQPDKLRDDIPDPGPNGVQMVSPTFEVPAGEEVFMCMRLAYSPDRDLYINSSNIYQSFNGHHTLVFYSNNSAGVDPLPHRCDGVDMTDVRIVTTGAANGAGLPMPEGVALKVPKGSELWIQSHYINASDEKRTVQDVINVETIPIEEVTEVASTFAHVDLTFVLPPNQRSSRTMECKVPQEMTVPWFLPHMHEWGESFKIEIVRDGVTRFEHEGPWFDGARNDFPVHFLETPMTLTPEDTIRTTCNWNNTLDENLLWPREMCVTFFPFYPGNGQLLACDESGETFAP
jgi:hypothetical protein